MIIANVLPSSVSGFDYSSLMTELFKQTARANLVHVSYKGGMAATTAIMADEVQVYFDSIGSAKSRIDAGCIRVLAETSEERPLPLPNVPTLKEAGVDGANPTSWLDIFVPRGTPPPIVGTLQKQMKRASWKPPRESKPASGILVPRCPKHVGRRHCGIDAIGAGSMEGTDRLASVRA